jgi:hypothetical protein
MSEANASARSAHLYNIVIFKRFQALFLLYGVFSMAKNLRPLAKKLQMAIAIKRDRKISIDQKQFYSTKAQRTVTKYTLTEFIEGKYKTLYTSWSLPEVIKYLASILNGEE